MFCAGAACLPVFLPLTVLYLLSVCRTPDGALLRWPPSLPNPASLWDPHTAAILTGWLGLQSALYLLPVGKVSTPETHPRVTTLSETPPLIGV